MKVDIENSTSFTQMNKTFPKNWYIDLTKLNVVERTLTEAQLREIFGSCPAQAGSSYYTNTLFGEDASSEKVFWGAQIDTVKHRCVEVVPVFKPTIALVDFSFDEETNEIYNIMNQIKELQNKLHSLLKDRES